MDPRIWSKLPQELLEHVLSFLPLKTFLNLRSTCKHFNSLVCSASFASKHSDASLPSFLLLAHPQRNQSFALYDSMLGIWCGSSLSPSHLFPKLSRSSSTLVSTSNGLFCLSLPSSFSFVVCNFLTKSSRKIDFPTFPFSFELLTFVSTRLGYQIFVTSSATAFLYDSRFHSWRRFGFDGRDILGGCSYQEGVHFNGSLYFTVSDPGPLSILCLNPNSGKLERHISDLPENITFVRLVSDGEKKLYLVGGIGANGISRTVKLWELSSERGGTTKRWVEIESLPDMMCRKFMSVCYHNYEHVYCLWHQGLICVCCYTWPEILYYKVTRATWHWLPKCPSLPEKWSCGFRWFSFLPEISAPV